MSSSREPENTRNLLCVVCKTKVLEPLEEEQLCFFHYIIYVEAKLLKFVKISRARPLTSVEKQEIVQLVDENSRRLLRASKEVNGPKVWEQKKMFQAFTAFIRLPRCHRNGNRETRDEGKGASIGKGVNRKCPYSV